MPKGRVRAVARRVASRARAHYTRRGGVGGIMGKLKPLLSGAIGGAAANVARSYNATYGGVAAQAAVGYFMNNDTLMTLAGMELGHNLVVMSGLTGNTTSSTGGGW